VRTPTSGFAAQVYVTSEDALPDSLDDPAWRLVATTPSASGRQTLDLDTAGQRSRWVLLWITKLPLDEDRVEISELTLYR
jgi:hypothetical protein